MPRMNGLPTLPDGDDDDIDNVIDDDVEEEEEAEESGGPGENYSGEDFDDGGSNGEVSVSDEYGGGDDGDAARPTSAARAHGDDDAYSSDSFEDEEAEDEPHAESTNSVEVGGGGGDARTSPTRRLAALSAELAVLGPPATLLPPPLPHTGAELAASDAHSIADSEEALANQRSGDAQSAEGPDGAGDDDENNESILPFSNTMMGLNATSGGALATTAGWGTIGLLANEQLGTFSDISAVQPVVRQEQANAERPMSDAVVAGIAAITTLTAAVFELPRDMEQATSLNAAVRKLLELTATYPQLTALCATNAVAVTRKESLSVSFTPSSAAAGVESQVPPPPAFVETTAGAASRAHLAYLAIHVAANACQDEERASGGVLVAPCVELCLRLVRAGVELSQAAGGGDEMIAEVEALLGLRGWTPLLECRVPKAAVCALTEDSTSAALMRALLAAILVNLGSACTASFGAALQKLVAQCATERGRYSALSVAAEAVAAAVAELSARTSSAGARHAIAAVASDAWVDPVLLYLDAPPLLNSSVPSPPLSEEVPAAVRPQSDSSLEDVIDRLTAILELAIDGTESSNDAVNVGDRVLRLLPLATSSTIATKTCVDLVDKWSAVAADLIDAAPNGRDVADAIAKFVSSVSFTVLRRLRTSFEERFATMEAAGHDALVLLVSNACQTLTTVLSLVLDNMHELSKNQLQLLVTTLLPWLRQTLSVLNASDRHLPMFDAFVKQMIGVTRAYLAAAAGRTPPPPAAAIADFYTLLLAHYLRRISEHRKPSANGSASQRGDSVSAVANSRSFVDAIAKRDGATQAAALDVASPPLGATLDGSVTWMNDTHRSLPGGDASRSSPLNLTAEYHMAATTPKGNAVVTEVEVASALLSIGARSQLGYLALRQTSDQSHLDMIAASLETAFQYASDAATTSKPVGQLLTAASVITDDLLAAMSASASPPLHRGALWPLLLRLGACLLRENVASASVVVVECVDRYVRSVSNQACATADSCENQQSCESFADMLLTQCSKFFEAARPAAVTAPVIDLLSHEVALAVVLVDAVIKRGSAVANRNVLTLFSPPVIHGVAQLRSPIALNLYLLLLADLMERVDGSAIADAASGVAAQLLLLQLQIPANADCLDILNTPQLFRPLLRVLRVLLLGSDGSTSPSLETARVTLKSAWSVDALVQGLIVLAEEPHRTAFARFFGANPAQESKKPPPPAPDSAERRRTSPDSARESELVAALAEELEAARAELSRLKAQQEQHKPPEQQQQQQQQRVVVDHPPSDATPAARFADVEEHAGERGASGIEEAAPCDGRVVRGVEPPPVDETAPLSERLRSKIAEAQRAFDETLMEAAAANATLCDSQQASPSSPDDKHAVDDKPRAAAQVADADVELELRSVDALRRRLFALYDELRSRNNHAHDAPSDSDLDVRMRYFVSVFFDSVDGDQNGVHLGALRVLTVAQRNEVEQEIARLQRRRQAVLDSVRAIMERERLVAALRDFVAKYERSPQHFHPAFCETILNSHFEKLGDASERVMRCVESWRATYPPSLESQLRPFFYRGRNYIAKMQHDLHFVLLSPIGKFTVIDLDNNVRLVPRRREIDTEVSEAAFRQRNFFARLSAPKGTRQLPRAAGALDPNDVDIVSMQVAAEQEREGNWWFRNVTAEVVRIGNTKAPPPKGAPRRESLTGGADALDDCERSTASTPPVLHVEAQIKKVDDDRSRQLSQGAQPPRARPQSASAHGRSANKLRSPSNEKPRCDSALAGGVVYRNPNLSASSGSGSAHLPRPAQADLHGTRLYRRSPLDRHMTVVQRRRVRQRHDASEGEPGDNPLAMYARAALEENSSRRSSLNSLSAPAPADRVAASASPGAGYLTSPGGRYLVAGNAALLRSPNTAVLSRNNLRSTLLQSTGMYWWGFIYHMTHLMTAIRALQRRVRRRFAAKRIQRVWRRHRLVIKYGSALSLGASSLFADIASVSDLSSTQLDPSGRGRIGSAVARRRSSSAASASESSPTRTSESTMSRGHLARALVLSFRQKTFAAITIQRTWRGYRRRQRFRTSVDAVRSITRIQGWWRHNRSAVEFRAEIRRRVAATAIARFFRARSEIAQRRRERRAWRCAIRIQRFFRQRTAKALVGTLAERRWAAVLIQCTYRAMLARREVGFLRSVRAVQSHMRFMLAVAALRHHERRAASAIRIQAAARGFLARCETRRRRDHHARLCHGHHLHFIAEKQEQTTAATTLQRTWRGCTARRGPSDVPVLVLPSALAITGKAASVLPQCRSGALALRALRMGGTCRIVMSSRVVEALRRLDAAAEVVQSILKHRAAAAEAQVRHSKVAIRLRFFTAWRCCAAMRATYGRRCAQRAADRFIALLRAAQSRQKVHAASASAQQLALDVRRTDAATAIQAVWRGHVVRQALADVLPEFAFLSTREALLQTRDEAACVIQRNYRLHLAWRKRQLVRRIRIVAATVRIQRKFRDILADRRFADAQIATHRRRVVAAMRIQALWRAYTDVCAARAEAERLKVQLLGLLASRPGCKNLRVTAQADVAAVAAPHAK